MSTAVKGLSLVLVFITNLISYGIIFPLAAWSHNIVFLVISLALPFLLVQGLKRSKSFTYTPKKQKSSESILLSVVVLAVFGMLLWNHFIFLTVALVVFLAVRQAKLKKRRF